MRGGKRAGAGRRAGTPNKITQAKAEGVDIKALAQEYTAEALKELHRIATQGQSEAARVSAIKELFDRGHGKSTQPVEHGGAGGGPIQIQVFQLPDE